MMNLTRRTFVAGVGAVGIAGAARASAFTKPTAVPSGIEVDRASRTIRFLRKVERIEMKTALRHFEIPHRWVVADSVELRGWTVLTPQLARGFGWTSLDSQGRVHEAWAELQVEAFSNDREFEVTVADERLATQDGSVHFRCDRFPRLRLHDATGKRRPADHLNLLAKHGVVARSHRLAAVA